MSQTYLFDLFIEGASAGKVDAIGEAVRGAWEFAPLSEDRPDGLAEGLVNLDSSGIGSLGAGKTPDEFAEEVAREVWRANGAFCMVRVYSTYMEDLPQDEHRFGIKEFKRLTKRAQAK